MDQRDRIVLANALKDISPGRRALLESALFAEAESEDQNLPETYYDLEPRGVQAAVAADPLSYNAFLSEFEQGRKHTMPVSQEQVAEISIATAANDLIQVLEGVQTWAATRTVGSGSLEPKRLAEKVSSRLSALMYNLGRLAQAS